MHVRLAIKAHTDEARRISPLKPPDTSTEQLAFGNSSSESIARV